MVATRRIQSVVLILFVVGVTCLSAHAAWQVADGPLLTRWAKDVSPENALPEYPRPQMVRDEWLNLNGLWDYAIKPRHETQPASFDGKILVPYAIESALSGVMKKVGPDNRLWYRREFEIPQRNPWTRRNGRILLHFGAVDWDATVWVNGKKVGEHRGGYDPFTLDITDALKENGPQELVLSVWDPTNAGGQPRGKQVREPRGIWYTAVTGIWQTVWLEPVPESSIRAITIIPDLDARCVWLDTEIAGSKQGAVVTALAKVKLNGLSDDRPQAIRAHAGADKRIKIDLPGYPSIKLWSPDSPTLHDLQISLFVDGKEIDRVDSYFGVRKIALGRIENDHLRLELNDLPLFQYGPLDQGWWPDGLYTAATDEALRYDIEVTKKLGMNMARKHVKVEPDRWYYWCDKLGLMVWQDMASGNNNDDEARKQFELEWKRVVHAFRNHPSIVMWVPFNEGWGQHDTERYVELTKQWDPTRLVNNASGWTDKGVGDVHDIHRYPGPGAPPAEPNRASVLGEFGGLGLPVSGHTWQDEKNWGYRSFKSREALTDAYVNLLENVRPLISDGLAAAVYTQTSDVEIEVNGLMTYDREMIKMDPEAAAQAAKRLHLPPPIIKHIVPSSQQQPQQWRYTTSEPTDGWEKPDFDDSDWKRGPAGFGTKGTPGAVVRTEWNTSDIWIRRTFELDDADLSQLCLSIHHDEDAEVYINGTLAVKLTGYTTDYVRLPLRTAGRGALKRGVNGFAVHCKQTGGGQYIDVGLVTITERDKE